MESIFVDANEKYVSKVILYPATVSDNAHLCIDKTHKKEIDAKTLMNLLMKGLVLVAGNSDEYFYPMAFKKTGGYVSIDVGNKAGTKYTFHSTEQA